MLFLEPGSAQIATRWARSSSLGIATDSDAYPVGTTDGDLVERRDRLAEVFREENHLLAPVADELAAREVVAIVADPDGVILAARGGGAFEDSATRVRLVEGAKWSEAARGTNAIGTALVERRSVAVIGAAHFERRNHGLFCYAQPIFDGYGDLVAVLDVSGPLDRHDRAVGLALRAAASSLELALRRIAYGQCGAGTFAAVERLIHRSATATMLLEANGRVAVANERARDVLGVADPATLDCERVFGLPFREIHRLAVSGNDGLRFETAAGVFRVQLDPLEDAAHRPFAAVVHLEGTPAPAPSRRAELAPHRAFESILGDDAALVRAKSAATRFARTNLSVLLLAETGTGKELFARAIHGASAHASGPFVALNCGALAPGVLESELFGHAPGAFTGASRNGADGKIAAAHGGTLFLDEVAEMPDALQAALLRVLDDGVHFRVGDARPRHSSFRLVCATCRDLPKLVDEGKFRRDLFFRIHGASITLPTLRDRTDRLALAEALLGRLGGSPLSSSARRWIEQHDWPGNVRELESALEHAMALADGDPIEPDDFPRVLIGNAVPATATTNEPRTRVAILNDAIMEAVRASAGNVSEAARRLGVARSTIYRVLRGKS